MFFFLFTGHEPAMLPFSTHLAVGSFSNGLFGHSIHASPQLQEFYFMFPIMQDME